MLLLLAALAVFAACDDDPIDYSTWTTEELLATPEGIDYLIEASAPVDYAAIEEELETLAFEPYYFFVHSARDGWTNSSDWIGGGSSSYVVMGDIVRSYLVCNGVFFRTPEGELTSRYYQDSHFTGDRLTAVLELFDHGRDNVKIKARIEKTLIVESYDEYEQRWLDLVRLVDSRDVLQEQFPYSLDELEPNGISAVQP